MKTLSRTLSISAAVAALFAVLALGSFARAQEATPAGETAAAPAPLSVTCDAGPNPVNTNEEVTWTAHPEGGNTYFYEWSGDGNFPGNQKGANFKTVKATYVNPGTRSAHVKVISGQQVAEADCEVVVKEVTPPPAELKVSCSASPNPGAPNEEITWTATVTGGTAQDHFAWTGAPNFPGPNQGTSGVNVKSVKATYANGGTKNAHVVVNSSNNRTAEADCSVQISENAPPPPGPASCDDPDPARDLEGFIIESVDANGMVKGHLTNNSDVCSYETGMASYEKLVFGLPHSGGVQRLFDGDPSKTSAATLGPGETRHFSVEAPDCAFQIDLFSGPHPTNDGVFNRPGWHLFHAFHDNSGGLCDDDIPQCPVAPPAITTNGSNQGTVGVPFAHDIFIENASAADVTTSGSLPQGLSFTPAQSSPDILHYVISGTPTQTGTFTFAVSASNQCGVDDATITITITQNQCPVAPPAFAKEGDTITGVVGQPLSYTPQLASGSGALSLVGVLPAGLSFNASNGAISGTPTAASDTTATIAVANQCGSDSLPLRIIVSGQCPAQPTITSVPPAANNVAPGASYSYTVTTSGGVAPVEILITPVNAAPGLTINGATLSGTLTTAGAFSYTVTAKSAGSPAQCAVSQTITISVVPPSSCPVQPTITSVPPSVNNVDTGTSYSYTVATSGGAQPVIIEITAVNAAPGLSINGATLSGTLTDEGSFSYNVTARSAGSPLSCAVSQTITMSVDDDDNGCVGDCGGGGGGGSSRRRPRVTLFSNPETPEVAGSFISLEQVPYTGVGSTILQIVLFGLGLIALSGGVTYALLRRKNSGAEVAAPVPVSSTPAYAEASAGKQSPAPSIAPIMQTTPEFAPAYVEPTPALAVPHNLPIAEVPREQIADSHLASRISESAPLVREVSGALLQNAARATHTLMSDDGAKLIAASAEGDERKALERLSQVIDIAKSRFPREDNWLILDKERVREALFISILSTVPLFIEWLVKNADKQVFSFLRMLKYQEQPVADFMRKVVAELDNAHRARTEGAEERIAVDAHVAEVTYHLSAGELERMIAELLQGVDERYENSYTSVRLSLVRVLDMLRERALSRIGGAYAPQQMQELR